MGEVVADDGTLAAVIPFVQVIATEFTASDFPEAQGMALDILAEAIGYDFEDVKRPIEMIGMMPVGFVMKSLQLLAILAYRAGAAALVMGGEEDEYTDDHQPDPADVLETLRIICGVGDLL